MALSQNPSEGSSDNELFTDDEQSTLKYEANNTLFAALQATPYAGIIGYNPNNVHRGSVNSVAYSPDGTRIVSGSDDYTIRQWDAKSGEPLGEPLTGHRFSVWSVAYSPDGTRIVSGSTDRTIRQWDAKSGEPLEEPLKGHTSSVLSVAYSPDGTRIVSEDEEGVALQWDAKTGKPIDEPFKGGLESAENQRYNPDGTKYVSFNSKSIQIQIRDTITKEVIGTPWDAGGTVNSVVWSPQGDYVIAGGEFFLAPYTRVFIKRWPVDFDPESMHTRVCLIARQHNTDTPYRNNLSLEEWDKYVGPLFPYTKICPTDLELPQEALDYGP